MSFRFAKRGQADVPVTRMIGRNRDEGWILGAGIVHEMRAGPRAPDPNPDFGYSSRCLSTHGASCLASPGSDYLFDEQLLLQPRPGGGTQLCQSAGTWTRPG